VRRNSIQRSHQPGSRHEAKESGVAIITSMIGALMMLFTLLATTHIIVNLQRRSLAHAVAVDAVTDAARDGASEAMISARVTRLLGPTARATWREVGPDIVLEVSMKGAAVIGVGPLREMANITVEARARKEELQ
jgi:hypothetical protein